MRFQQARLFSPFTQVQQQLGLDGCGPRLELWQFTEFSFIRLNLSLDPMGGQVCLYLSCCLRTPPSESTLIHSFNVKRLKKSSSVSFSAIASMLLVAEYLTVPVLLFGKMSQLIIIFSWNFFFFKFQILRKKSKHWTEGALPFVLFVQHKLKQYNISLYQY